MAQSFDPIIAPVALLTHGLTAFDTVEGIGLVTFGFLWPCNGIWGPTPEGAVRNTVWTACANGGC